ncbi:AraC family transcriptional regulator [Marinobacter subterrani]|uniref:AraC-type DNA-binding domain-containing protein n=1 Tax=Marinobacter subterrani TaxID=1658765 RepID=A0A0J7J8Q6_9GAMM|nr:AraC family transcriptional regulator [Marinobacter subterrani]KMQ74364.1 AraC-type DNA-binding domain-containing protein [Marinobacter subterrani]
MTATIPEISGNLTLNLQQQLARVARQWTTYQGIQGSAIDGVELVRCDEPSSCGSSVYEPSLCFVIQGTKTIQLGDREITYRPLTYLASSVHLPVLGRIVDASEEQPYLAAKLKVDPQEVAELVLELGDKAPPLHPNESCPEIQCGLCVSSMDEQMQSALYRLLRLLDSPSDIPILAPLARREIIYRALVGEMGSRMRKFAAVDSQAHRISTVISALKDHYAAPLRISELAEAANMSESTLYHSFKQVTRMSPLQFQKKLRLHEARRLMLIEGLEAATASYRVGYESPSHFSREYSRMFGAPPKADVTLLRGARETAESV